MFEYKEYIYAVYKHKSFSKAADSLFISQSTLSLMVKKAERLLGASIFNRKTSPLSLTPFGIEYINAIEQIHRLEGEIDQFLDDEQALRKGSLSIGGHNFGMNYLVPQKIAEFHNLYPNINLKIIEMNTVHSKHCLDAGELDLVITNRNYDPQKYEQKICYRESLVLVVPASFPINRSLTRKQLKPSELGDSIFNVPEARTAALDEFRDVPFILLSSTNYLRECTNLLFHESNFTPEIVFEMEQSSVSYNFAKMGVGATILSNRLVEHDIMDGSVCIYKIKSDHVDRDTYISYRKGCYFTFAMRKFMEIILSVD